MNPEKIEFNMDEIRKFLSPKEIALCVTLGNIINDIMMTHKLLAAYANRYENETEDLINSYQAIALIINQIGMMFECKKTINRAFADPEIRKQYQEELSDEGKEALSKINEIMGGGKFEQIRKRLANHYDIANMESIICEFSEEFAKFDIVRGSDWSLTRFLFADRLRSIAVLNIWGCSDVNDIAQEDKTLQEIVASLSQCTLYLHAYINEVMNKMFLRIPRDGISITNLAEAKLAILEELKIPFFVSKK